MGRASRRRVSRVLNFWRRLSLVQQDLLLAVAIAIGWFGGLTLINHSDLRPKNPSVSVVTGIFLVLTVAMVRTIPADDTRLRLRLLPAGLRLGRDRARRADRAGHLPGAGDQRRGAAVRAASRPAAGGRLSGRVERCPAIHHALLHDGQPVRPDDLPAGPGRHRAAQAARHHSLRAAGTRTCRPTFPVCTAISTSHCSSSPRR